MVRNYIRNRTTVKKIAYMKEKPPEVTECIKLAQDKKITIKEMAKRLGISHTTALKYVRNNNDIAKVGHPTIFSHAEELIFKEHILKLSQYGFSITKKDLQMIVSWYLLELDREIPAFQNNTPGEGWISRFVSRHEGIARQFDFNISRECLSVNEEVINNYMDNLALTIAGVPAENILSYDEINFSHDSETEEILCRRNSKYPEEEVEKNLSESSTSVMFCATATGSQVPPYIIFKSEYLRCPWFDGQCFDDWFIQHLFPILEKLPGKKVLIGDNFSSHISIKVLQFCERENVHFVCLPSNSTHLTQPLDDAYFQPLKTEWRKCLIKFKQDANSNDSLKDNFALLLNSCLDNLNTISNNIQSGFRKCGIYPFNRILAQVAQTIPEGNHNAISE